MGIKGKKSFASNVKWWSSYHYNDISYGSRRASTCIRYLRADGEVVVKHLYDSGFLDDNACIAWIEADLNKSVFSNKTFLMTLPSIVLFVLFILIALKLIIFGGCN